jgi:PAS domain S-box-containing protein
MWARGELVRDTHGTPVRVRGVVMDITGRKQAEEQLRRSEHGLAEAQRIAHLGNWELDLVHNVLTWSDEIYRIFEIDPEKFGASYEAFLNTIHPDDRELVNNAYTESLKSKKPYDIAHRLLMQDGRVKYVNEKCETHYGEDGKPLRSVGTVHDITELKRAEDEVNALNRELEQRVVARTADLEAANKELESFSYSVSHDLRTPLRAIDGFSGMLLEDYAGKLDDEGKRLLNVVRDNTIRMGQLIDDILKFSRTGRLELTFAKIDMEKLAREVLAELQPSVADGKLQVEIEPIPPARGDNAMMHQVFVNLLSNAIKFSRNRDIARIKVGGAIEGDEAVYYVKDNGAGFDMEFADKLFGVFQRLHGVTEFEGTGIGLAIVKRIVTRHGGRVWAEGKVNEGATIYFALPTKEIGHG